MPKFKENILLSGFSHYKIGGKARFFFEPKTVQEVRWAVKEAKKRTLKIFILGGGTNLLIDDKGINGLVIRPNLTAIKVKKTTITAGAGVMMDEVLKSTIKGSLSGLEWAGGLPGTLGGAIRGNAGCFGGEIKDSIASVESFDIKTMKIVRRTARQSVFGYRNSIFKKKNGTEIILGATLKLKKGSKRQIAAAIQEKIDYRAKHHPIEYPNIGSIFKNVPLTSVHKEGSPKYKKALQGFIVDLRGSKFSVKTDPFPVLSAGKFISESGLRGVSFGGAMISPKHPNFIVNVLGAASGDVRNLITLAKANVKKKFGLTLEEEVQIV
jgi:UDP-N-acetylmuramate dehydrogenase